MFARVLVQTEPLLQYFLFIPAFMPIKGDLLAKPNYQFEKRQKELAKKNKKEEKRRQKEAGITTGTDDDGSQTELASPEDDAAPDQVVAGAA